MKSEAVATTAIMSVSCSSRSVQEESPVATEVRKVRQSGAALCGLPPVPPRTTQPIARTLRPQVQEGQEELPLPVSVDVGCLFSGGNPERCLASPLRCGSRIYIFSLFIIGSSLNGFPRLSTGLSTSSGTTEGATCFPLTVSPTVRRGSPTPASRCMKKKVHAVRVGGFARAQVQRWWRGRRRVRLRGVWSFSGDNKCRVPPFTLPLLNHSPGPSRMDKQAAHLIVNKKKLLFIARTLKDFLHSGLWNLAL